MYHGCFELLVDVSADIITVFEVESVHESVSFSWLDVIVNVVFFS